MNPYTSKLTYDSVFFHLRLVEETDAKDLLTCYSDPKSAQYFNSDNCTSDFIYHTEEEVLEIIKFWLREYEDGGYVRFSIIDQMSQKAVGTIELFKRDDDLGMLRLDLASTYEKDSRIQDLVRLLDQIIYKDFNLSGMITKIPENCIRNNVFKRNDYKPYNHKENYYVKHYLRLV